MACLDGQSVVYRLPVQLISLSKLYAMVIDLMYELKKKSSRNLELTSNSHVIKYFSRLQKRSKLFFSSVPVPLRLQLGCDSGLTGCHLPVKLYFMFSFLLFPCDIVERVLDWRKRGFVS